MGQVPAAGTGLWLREPGQRMTLRSAPSTSRSRFAAETCSVSRDTSPHRCQPFLPFLSHPIYTEAWPPPRGLWPQYPRRSHKKDHTNLQNNLETKPSPPPTVLRTPQTAQTTSFPKDSLPRARRHCGPQGLQISIPHPPCWLAPGSKKRAVSPHRECLFCLKISPPAVDLPASPHSGLS